MKFPSALSLHRLLDRVAAAFSMLCAAHCAIVPLAMVMIPALTLALYQFKSPLHGVAQWMLLSHSFERAFAAVSLSLCLMSLLFGWRRHQRLIAFAPWAVGGVCLALGTLTAIAFIPFWHALFLFSGGAAVAWAHLLNLRLVRLERDQPRAHGPLMATVKPGA